MSDLTLREILNQLNVDEAAEHEIDFVKLIGDLRNKVDNTKHVVDRLEAEADMLTEKWIQPLMKRRDALLKNRQRLLDYCKTQMILNNFEKLPGQMFSIRLQNSQPSVIVTAEANAESYLKHSDVMSQTVSYAWDKRAIREILESGNPFPGAELKTDKHVRFHASKKEIEG